MIVRNKILIRTISVAENPNIDADKLKRRTTTRYIKNRSVKAVENKWKLLSFLENSRKTIGSIPRSTNLDRIPTIAIALLNRPKFSTPRARAAITKITKLKTSGRPCPKVRENIFFVILLMEVFQNWNYKIILL